MYQSVEVLHFLLSHDLLSEVLDPVGPRTEVLVPVDEGGGRDRLFVLHQLVFRLCNLLSQLLLKLLSHHFFKSILFHHCLEILDQFVAKFLFWQCRLGLALL